ncbi:MAG: family 43 glycosylhydrolase, partial [Clostridia bacterium]|nr:family 43 glycosylhydrolase [Clostridia bacterium]
PDGTVLGRGEGDPIQFDPGVFMDDDGSVYLYSGNASPNPSEPRPRNYSQVMRLKSDMLTLAEAPKRLLPDIHHPDPEYAGHEFFEASSIRKINGRYYLVYSSVRSHELCWAVSDAPDRDFRFGGTLVDIGDVGLNGRTDANALNALGNTHGGIECCNGQWYVFYHRQTNRTQFSRQACAEKIYFDQRGHIAQVEVTSCGLNQAPLRAEGMYPAYIACALTRNGKSVFSNPEIMGDEYPYFTQDERDCEPCAQMEQSEPVQYIANLCDGATVSYKYFEFVGNNALSLQVRGQFQGEIQCFADEMAIGKTNIDLKSVEWSEVRASITPCVGVHALTARFAGKGSLDWRQFVFCNDQ